MKQSEVYMKNNMIPTLKSLDSVVDSTSTCLETANNSKDSDEQVNAKHKKKSNDINNIGKKIHPLRL